MASSCPECGFELWLPIGRLSVTTVGLYDDARFPGRLIVALDEHHEHFDELPPELTTRFVADLQAAGRLLRQATGSQRINYAVLGNMEPHIHAHVIPRGGPHDPQPNKAPWQSSAPRAALAADERAKLIADLARALVDQGGNADL